MLPQHEYSWGDRHPLSADRRLPFKLRRPPAAGQPVGDAGRVAGQRPCVLGRDLWAGKSIGKGTF